MDFPAEVGVGSPADCVPEQRVIGVIAYQPIDV